MLDLSNQPVRGITKEQQTRKVRHKPKRGNHTKFSPKVRKTIIARDNGLCVRCKRPYHNIHHITFASAGGAGEANNGVCVCIECHTWAHAGEIGRRWFERYKEKHLTRERESG